jgi:hypothetical protein
MASLGELAGRQGVPIPASRRIADFGCALLIPSVFGASRAKRFATAFSLWLPDAASSSAMTLETTLAAKRLRAVLAEILREELCHPFFAADDNDAL